MKWRDETTGQPALWFKTTVQVLFGLILVIWVYDASKTRERYLEGIDAQRQQKAAQTQQEKAQSIEALRAEFQAHRADVIRGLQYNISSGAYILALHDASKFHELNDPEIEQFIKTAHEKAQKQEKEEGAAILKKMAKTRDKVEQIDWYKDKSTDAWGNEFFLYIGKRSVGKPWLRLEIRYFASNWLFVDSFTVVADDMRYDRPQANFKRDNGEGRIWETYDENLSQSDLGMVWKIVQSKEAIIRLHGDQGVQDLTITKAQKAALQNVIEAFEVLGGNLGDL